MITINHKERELSGLPDGWEYTVGDDMTDNNWHCYVWRTDDVGDPKDAVNPLICVTVTCGEVKYSLVNGDGDHLRVCDGFMDAILHYLGGHIDFAEYDREFEIVPPPKSLRAYAIKAIDKLIANGREPTTENIVRAMCPVPGISDLIAKVIK